MNKELKPPINKVNIRELPFIKLIPNIATVAALCMGLSAILFAIQKQYKEALIAIIVAAFLDGIDGRIARLLKATSEFGAELDSLSDFISFGVGPAIIVYLISLRELGNIGWGIVVVFAVCMGLRLARFNVANIQKNYVTDDDNEKKSTYDNKFSVGVPAPAGAFIVLSPIAGFLATGYSSILSEYSYVVIVIITSLLLVSKIPTYSLKNIKVSRNNMPLALLIVAVIVTLMIVAPWALFSLINILYLLSIFFSYREYKKKYKKIST